MLWASNPAPRNASLAIAERAPLPVAGKMPHGATFFGAGGRIPDTGQAVHLMHLSARESVAHLRRAQAAGLFRLNLPRSLGGFELDPATTAEIFEEISRADGVDRVFRLAGADAVYAHHPPQRCFRDVHAAGQHILFSTGRDQAYAKVCLGIGQPTFLI